MADELGSKISELNSATTVSTTDILPIVQSAETKKATFALLPVSTPQQSALDLKANDNSVVKLTGDQTVAGTKTFSTAPVLSALTASEILATDASKNVQTLQAATYPTPAELAYVKGVTSAIQTQISAKAPIASPTFTGTATTPALNISGETASTIAVFDASKNLISAALATYPSFTELSYVKGVTSAIQTQVDSVRTTSTQNSKSEAYTLVLSDAGKTILHPSADTTARTFTIPANSSVSYGVGTCITIVNQNSAGVVTIAITDDTMRLAGAGTTGSRTLAANGIATLIKLTSTEWIISGVGLT